MQENIYYILKFFILLLFPFASFSQESITTDSRDHNIGAYSLALIMANTIVPNSFTDETGDVIIVPTFGFNYDYQFKSRWGLGLHTDIILQEYKIEKHGDKSEVVRENPISISGVLFYKPHHKWKILGGYGIEMEKNENFQLVKLGVEYGIELPKDWELGFTLESDYKINSYYTMLLGISFTKKFVKQR